MKPPFRLQINVANEGWKLKKKLDTLNQGRDFIRGMQRDRDLTRGEKSNVTLPVVFVRVLDADGKVVITSQRLN